MLVTGGNGVGKTNLLEALHVGTQGFSPRTRAETQVVRFGEDAARVSLAGKERESPFETQVTVRLHDAKEIRLNGVPVVRAEELRTRLGALVFLPDRLAVVKGGPLVRRSYFDRMLGRLFPASAALPSEYGRALAQRNEALRRVHAGISTREAVEPWTERVSELGSELDRSRAALVALLAPAYRDSASLLGLEDARIRYEERPLSVEELNARLERDLVRVTTGTGPHLRDVELTAGERDLRSFGSQGEQRSSLLALVLAEATLVSELRGSPPLLLLDDVLSELDRKRRIALLANAPAGAQTVVSATARDAVPAGAPEPSLVLEVTPGRAAAYT